VDKHSTGGVGDKTSLILAPLVAAAGVPVPMMAGRGLGHTGGTLDKLESISGFSVRLTFEQFQKQVASVGTAIMGQTLEICPADRKLYALRDVTGTIDCLPLICGSIMSKKLAEGMNALVLDVKFGSGAFMKTVEDGEKLARALMEIGKLAGKTVVSMITRMDEPLGRFVGNSLEVRECLDILDGKSFAGEGKSYDDTVQLTLELAGQMIFLGGKAPDPRTGRELAQKLLREGHAKTKFIEMCRAQGGDLNKPEAVAAKSLVVRAETSGYMSYRDVEKIGSASVLLGAGRKFQADVIDFAAGIEVFRSQGDPVRVGDTVFTMFASQDTRLSHALPVLKESFMISPQPVTQSPLIAKVLT
jgi:pyrimidine-nucleoside phosphorylase